MEITRFKTPKGKDAFSLDGYCFRVDKRSADGEECSGDVWILICV